MKEKNFVVGLFKFFDGNICCPMYISGDDLCIECRARLNYQNDNNKAPWTDKEISAKQTAESVSICFQFYVIKVHSFASRLKLFFSSPLLLFCKWFSLEKQMIVFFSNIVLAILACLRCCCCCCCRWWWWWPVVFGIWQTIICEPFFLLFLLSAFFHSWFFRLWRQTQE